MHNNNEAPEEALAVLQTINRILDVAPMEHEQAEESGGAAEGGLDIEALCRGIDEARASKDWGKADELRNQLQDAGYEVRNSPEGTVATKQLA